MGAWREKFANWVKSLSTRQKILIGIVVASVAIAILYQIPGSGFGKDKNESETKKGFLNPKDGEIIEFTEKTTNHQSAKTLWDWLQLGGVIAIPVALFYFERREQRRSERGAKEQQEQADKNLREQVLEAYIDRMSELLIDKQLKLLIDKNLEESDPEYPVLDAALDIARARTLSVLRRLDQDRKRKGSIIRFLFDAELISGLGSDRRTLDLNGADLSSAYLKGANLEDANLSSTYLEGANLEDAKLSGANLESAYFKGANLKGANLEGAKLSGANLEGANLEGANLSGAKLSGAKLRIGIGYVGNAYVANANLSNADVSIAQLNSANLEGAENLAPEQVKQAKNWEKAKYSEEFRAKLGLPPEPAK